MMCIPVLGFISGIAVATGITKIEYERRVRGEYRRTKNFYGATVMIGALLVASVLVGCQIM